MKFRRNGFLPTIVAVAIAIVAFNAASYAQFTVTLSVTGDTTQPAPSGPLDFSAQVDLIPNQQLKEIVFYRNDVPYKTFTGPVTTQELGETELGQDTYTYRARAYDTDGNWVDSNNIKITINTPRVFKMGQELPVPTTPQIPNGETHVGNRLRDHTIEIQAAVNYLAAPNLQYPKGGGTLFFPCSWEDPNDPVSIYNIRNTITIPSNVTLQGESAVYGGRCQMRWRDVGWNPLDTPGTPDPDDDELEGRCHNNQPTTNDPNGLRNAAMFSISGGKDRVRFKDMWLHSMSSGPNCWARSDERRIAVENTTAVVLDGSSGDITDIILENVSFSNFTYGIRATTCITNPTDSTICTQETDNKIHDIKIRGVAPLANHWQLYIDAKYTYNWEVQNFNITAMGTDQGAVNIKNAGAPLLYEGLNKGLKFLQLNCNGNAGRTPAHCVRVEKHGGLYFKQLHQEGVKYAINVENIAPRTNSDPIIFDGSGVTGQFNDASMKLYLIGNTMSALLNEDRPGQDNSGLRFSNGSGEYATVIDCGDIHMDGTDTRARENPNTTPLQWGDFRMLFTHSERNRGGFFVDGNGYSYVKPHTNCPAEVKNIGGEHFDTGIMPTELSPLPYINVIDSVNCPPESEQPEPEPCDATALLNGFFNPNNPNVGSVYIDGTFKISQTITIPNGRQIIGAPGAELISTVSNGPLFKINALLEGRTTGVIIRNLKLKKVQTATGNTSGITINNEPARYRYVESSPPGSGYWELLIQGALSDVHFSGLTIEGFTTGFDAGPGPFVLPTPPPGPTPSPTPTPGPIDPMLDGVSLKNMTLVNNQTAVRIASSNTSNWNVMDLTMESNSADALGWYQSTGWTSLQNVTCRGTTANPMKDCIRMVIASTYLTGLKQTQNVTNALTIGEGGTNFTGIYKAIQPSNLLIRNSDFTSSGENMARVNILGKANITSMSNKYGNFVVSNTIYEGNLSRVTHCGDTYIKHTAYPGLDELYNNLVVGVLTPTRIACGGKRPVPWEDTIRWGGEREDTLEVTPDDKPMVGNFFDNVREDFVIYREGTVDKPQSEFLIKKVNGPESLTVDWGLVGDIPLIANFFPNEQRARIVIWQPSTGDWWARDPHKPASDPTGISVWHWGQTGDVPFVGNFDDTDPEDESAVYRPNNQALYIYNPRNGAYKQVQTNFGYESDKSNFQVGDFFGKGYDQIAHYKQGVWDIIDPKDGSTYPAAVLGDSDDVPVAGEYLPKLTETSPSCTQLGVWRPETEQFIIMDHPSSNCGGRSTSMIWGSNNDFVGPNPSETPLPDCPSGICPDDIPLTISTEDGKLSRPTAYRRTKGAFPYSIANGQWWVHDPF